MKRSRDCGDGSSTNGKKLHLHLNKPILAYLRESSVEVVDDEDMRSLYSHQWGYVGKGTVSRRMPNRAMLVPPELIEEFMKTQSQSGVQFDVGSDTRKYDEKDKRFVSSAITSSIQPSSKVEKLVGDSCVSSLQLSNPINTSLDATSDADKAIRHYEDVLTRYAHDFERLIASQPLPNAFLCASVASAHAHEVHPFDVTRSFAHYVSSPPPRLRHILPAPSLPSITTSTDTKLSNRYDTTSSSEVNETTPTLSSSINDSDSTSFVDQTAQQKGSVHAGITTQRTDDDKRGSSRELHRTPPTLSQQVQIAHVIFETSIVEPEAAVYALSRSRGRFIVLPSLERGAAEGGASVPTGLSIDRLWRHFCERILNFPARAAFYAHARDTGFVVRDGHAFGSDFELYPHGPGISHGTVCVIVMPLGIYRIGDEGPVMAVSTSSENIKVPQPHKGRMGVMRNWVQAHAHGRVIGTVRKAFALAYTEICVPQRQIQISPSVTDETSRTYYADDIAAVLLDPKCALGTVCNNDDVAGNDKNDLTFTEAQIKIKLHSLSRWQVNLEHNKKKSAVMQQIALTEAEIFASDEVDAEDTTETVKKAQSKQSQKLNMRKLLQRAKPIQNDVVSNATSQEPLKEVLKGSTTNRNKVYLLDLLLPPPVVLDNKMDEDPVEPLSKEQFEKWDEHRDLVQAFKNGPLFASTSSAPQLDSADDRRWYVERSMWVKMKSFNTEC